MNLIIMYYNNMLLFKYSLKKSPKWKLSNQKLKEVRLFFFCPHLLKLLGATWSNKCLCSTLSEFIYLYFYMVTVVNTTFQSCFERDTPATPSFYTRETRGHILWSKRGQIILKQVLQQGASQPPLSASRIQNKPAISPGSLWKRIPSAVTRQSLPNLYCLC